MTDLAILIKTFLRDEVLYGCVRSIERQACTAYRLYIADDGHISTEKDAFYSSLEEQGHFVLRLRFHTPVTAARNALVDALKAESYVLRLDDDFEFHEGTNLEAMMQVLDGAPDLGAVAGLEYQVGHGKGVPSGHLNDRQGHLYRENDRLVKSVVPLRRFKWEQVGHIKFARCGFSRNMLMIRRSVFADARWDERIRYHYEHEDFFLALDSAGWGLAITPDSSHLHRADWPSTDPDSYERLKHESTSLDSAAFFTKWAIREIVTRRPLTMGAFRRLRRKFPSIGRGFDSRDPIPILDSSITRDDGLSGSETWRS